MNNIISIDPSEIPTPKLHGIMLSAVAPRPIAFASTIDKEGRVNLSPFSFFNVFSANPPIMIFSPARRVRGNTTKHTLENIQQVPETVINIVNYSIVEQMSLSSTEYDKGVNEFVKAGLTEVPSEKIKPPRVGESPVAFECKVEDVIKLGNEGGAGNLIISKVVMVHLKSEYMDEDGKLDTVKLDLVSRMGGSWYCRAAGDALFEIPKPIRDKGIGIDQLPEAIRNSEILTGNNLGRLGNIPSLPDEASILTIKKDADVAQILSQYKGGEMISALHRLAQKYLEEGDVEKAIKILMLYS